MTRDLPGGTVTFLFTDVEGSTGLLHELGAEAYARALAQHRRVIREACSVHGGIEVDTQGDAFFFAFPTAPAALVAAEELTGALAGGPIQVRVGLHTGMPLVFDEGYVGDDVHFAARVAASAHGGQVVLSRATRDLVDGAELVDLGEHRLKDIAEPVALFQLGEGSFPPLKTISNTNLPRPASSFVGRERELGEVLGRIERGARLITLTGPGGSGKTRLAIEAAASLVPEYKAGVFWVGLAALRDPALVTETISQTLGAKGGLAEHVGERELLLLLDNLEQVIEAAPKLAALVTACPNLTLLVTSRVLLRVQGEVEYSVPPLAQPEAVALFCERSQLEPNEEIAELCARLDNLPLAVELAAARTKALTPKQVLERLSQRLDLLKGGRDADPRQQTLRATIEWSYDLLSDQEKSVFRSISVFAGGFVLAAADQVAEADLDTLQSLVERSLLRFTNGRFWLLETIREYAAERLLERGETRAAQQRQAAVVLELAEEAKAGLFSPESASWLARLEAEHGNLRAALAFLGKTDRADLQLELVVHTGPFWCFGGRWIEGRRWLDAALSQNGGERDLRRAEALRWAASIALSYDWEAAAAYGEESLSIARELDDPESVLQALKRCAWAAARQGRLDDAARLFEERIVAAHAVGDEQEVALASLDLGGLALDRREYERALALAEEGLAVIRRLGRSDLAPVAAVNRAHCLIRMGREEQAIPAVREAVAAAYDVHNVELLAVALGHAASLAMRSGEAEAAARYLGAAAESRERLATGLYGAEAALEHETTASLRGQLGDARFEEALAEGRAMSLDDAVAQALDALPAA